MSTLLIQLYILLALHGGESMDGYAPRYAPGLMQKVAVRRHMEVTPCMVSSPYYPLGTWVWVWGRKTYTLSHCKVVDVSSSKDRDRHIRTKRVVELSYENAITICGIKNINNRPEECPITVIKINE